MLSDQIVAPPVPTSWSQQHQDLFAWFSKGDERMVAKMRAEGMTPRAEVLALSGKHVIDRARAGTGKTTGIVKGIEFAPEDRIGMFAFNKPIQEELSDRVKHVANAEVVTVHSAGFRIVLRYWEKMPVARPTRLREESLVLAALGEADFAITPDVIKRLIGKLCTLGREMRPHAKALGDLTDLAYEFDAAPDEGWERDGFGMEFVERKALLAMDIAARKRPQFIDYADMIYLPIRNRWIRPMFGLVVVDEAQDMTVAQLEIARGLCYGRMCLVGDDRQGIYGFRGADTASLDRLKEQLGAVELNLTTTYRCPKLVVADAQKLVPDYEAAPSAPDGVIERIAGLPTGSGKTAMDLDKLVATVAPHDFVLSRSNAPLAVVAMALVRAMKRVRIKGRDDFGAGLKSLVKRLATGRAKDSIPQLLDRLKTWEEREVKRATAAGKDEQAERARDKAETLRVIMEGVSGVRELDARIDHLFSDNADEPAVICSSVHKAKGLEAKRVFVLRGTLYPALPCECHHYHDRFTGRCHCGCTVNRPSPKRELEEVNIHYVAITRTMETLVYVDGKPGLAVA